MISFTIITVVRNRRDVIADCIRSVASQTYPGIEHIIIDGVSTDGTLDVVTQMLGVRSQEPRVNESKRQGVGSQESKVIHYPSPITPYPTRTRVVSEPDSGIYDAMNKGIRMATSAVIGFLNSDDIYAHDRVIERVAAEMEAAGTDSCYGDLVYVARRNTRRIIRYWKSSPFTPDLLRKGWMPAYPAFFVRRAVYERCGLFDTSFSIAGDYEMVLRLLGRCGISTLHIPEVLVRMRLGGVSNRIPNIFRKSREDLRAMRMHKTGGIFSLFLKNVSKLPQFFRR